MAAVAVGRLHSKGEELVLTVTYLNEKDCEEHPEHALGVLLLKIWWRVFEISRSDEAELPPELMTLLWKWVYAGQPLSRDEAIELARHKSDEWSRNRVLLKTKGRGRPIRNRQRAIKALFRHEYLNKTWREVTLRLCECAGSSELELKKLQDVIEVDARHLKTLLKKCRIDFPPAHIQTAEQNSPAGELLPKQNTNPVTQEPPSNTTKREVEMEQPCPAIKILLDSREPLPVIDFDDISERDALEMFNPWIPGWVPMWFPEEMVRGSEPVELLHLSPDQRLEWFEKTLENTARYSARSEWPPKGSLTEQRQLIADCLLRMYRAARIEAIPPIVLKSEL